MGNSSLRRVLFALVAAVSLVSLGANRAWSDGFDLPIGTGSGLGEDEPPPPPSEDQPPKFYDEDIPNASESVIYVIDRSSSMSLPVQPFTNDAGAVVSDGSRLDYVKSELRRSISSLPENYTFNMIIYSECVNPWRPSRVVADAANKAAALAWVDAIEPWGWTNTGGATSTALDDHPNKCVLLLSDGAPNFLDCAETCIADFDTHRRVIRASNLQGAVVHTFGIGLDTDTRQFMQNVAHDSGGTFREID
jgi:hypothetical protein